MKSKTHTTASGHRIEVEVSPKVAAFLARLEEIVGNPKISAQEMIGVAYSAENPILDHTLFPGRGAVTRAVLDDPAYGVVTDLLFRKQLAQDGTDVERIAARFSMTVGEAAAELGIHESAVRQAIAAKRLASWMKEGRHYVEPRALKTLEVGTRAPVGPRKPAAGGALAVKMGSCPGASFSVRTPIAIVDGQISTWKRVVVRSTGARGSKRAWVLEPATEDNEIVHGDFFVRGRFAVVASSNNPRKADELWKTTQPA
jgi:excisionase family DNA binding protein